MAAVDEDVLWDDDVLVVSPYHAQIRLIRQELRDRTEWDREPFVDTVDRVQGQEREAVIVNYGVSDVEHALRVKEFIYQLNRLNVSITRARSNTIVFMSRSLLELPGCHGAMNGHNDGQRMETTSTSMSRSLHTRSAVTAGTPNSAAVARQALSPSVRPNRDPTVPKVAALAAMSAVSGTTSTRRASTRLPGSSISIPDRPSVRRTSA